MPTGAEPTKESVSQSVSRSRRVALGRAERSRGRLLGLSLVCNFSFPFFFFILLTPPTGSFLFLSFCLSLSCSLPPRSVRRFNVCIEKLDPEEVARAVRRQRDYSELSSGWNAERDLRDLGTGDDVTGLSLSLRGEATMSTQCNRFVQNAWKKELCSNCFKPREEHVAADEALRLNVEKASTNLKIGRLQLQSILRANAACRKDQRKKNVGFPESLAEIIGYGGDDFFSDGDEDGNDVDSGASPEDEVPDSEEERALGNLTRANTNFNTITANLTDAGSNGSNDAIRQSTTTPPKSFASLMLGRIQRDADGRKTTLLVSVTPFGGDETVPTAKRPVDRRINNAINLQNSPFKCKLGNGGLADNMADATKRANGAERKKADEPEQKHPPELEKIVDMPLITSANMIAVVRKESSTGGPVDAEKAAETTRCAPLCKPDKRNAILPRNGVPTMKKTEAEASRIPTSGDGVGESDRVKRTAAKKSECPKREEEAEGVEVVATPSRSDEAPESERSTSIADKDTDDIRMNSRERQVEGRCETSGTTEEVKKFCFDSSRELAGEPDGMADEEEVTEPPALPTSPPPILTTEPRSSFLHGGVINDSKAKPAVPQKPLTFSAKASPTDAPLTARKNGDYVLPPPSVQNVAGRPLQNFSTPDTGLRRAAKKTAPNQVPSAEAERVSPGANQSMESESRGKTPSKSVPTPPSTPTVSPSTLSLPKTPTEGEEANENGIDEDFTEVTPVSVSTMELIRSPNKRRMAPRPPAAESAEELLPASSLFARNPGAILKSDSPVVREKEKRERSSSCSPKFRKAVCDLPDPTSVGPKQPVEIVPRRTISLSQDSLASEKEAREEKKRNRNRRGFSLKRFLRMGSRKDMDMMNGQTSGAKTDEIPSTPQPKPRLEIIHPLELDGAAVEVVGNDRVAGRVGEDQTDSCGAKGDGSKAARLPPPSAARPGKPPPPPRNQSLEDWSRLEPASKPVRPPPPRAEVKLSVPARSEKTSSKSTWRPTATTTTSDSIYANLAAEDVTGEVRSALAPSKPQRTASLRDRAISQPVPKRHGASAGSQHQDYDGLVRPTGSDSPTSNDSHVYECLSSSPECDSNLELRHGIGGGFRAACKRKSDSSVMENGAEKFHHHQPFVRSTSLPYCGSETESELYAPYTFYAGDEGAEEDQDWKSRDDEPRMSRLRQRRGRSIVHRSLEDNYGAVVVANHEALAQFLEQENQTTQLPVTLRALKNANPRLKHFSVDTLTSVCVGRRIFYPATWNEQNVTLCVTFDLAVPTPQKDFYLAPIIEFVDTVPKEMVEKARPSGNVDMEATISVFPRVHVSTVQSFGAASKDNASNEGANKETSFVLLQLVNALKSLQARGIEDTGKSLGDVVLCREDKDACYRLYLLQGRLNIDPCDESGEERVSLCECALIALQQLHLASELPLVRDLLIREKAVTLSQVKSVLEFSLWGPADVLPLGGPREREVALQRWLDLERANVLHALVKTKAALTVTDEYQLLFLVRTTAKIMSEASVLLDEQRNRLTRRI